MFFLSDWAPNLHPLVVHFPIALLFCAVLLDAAGLFLRKTSFLRKAATVLFTLGALAALAAWLTGRQAADSVFLPTAANALLTEHADLGQWTLWYFGGYALLRLSLSFGSIASKGLVRGLLFVLGLGGLGLLTITADHGAELVFRHGVGVQAVEDMPVQSIIPEDASAVDRGGLTLVGDSLWVLDATRPAAWMKGVEWLSGSPEGMNASIVDGAEMGDVLALSPADPDPLFVVPMTLESIQVDFTVNIDDFDGSIIIAHHILDVDNFRFLSIDRDDVRAGAREQGDFVVGSSTPTTTEGWHTFRLVVDGSHVRVYRDTELIGHAHSSEPAPGPVGLRLNGTGRVLLGSVQVTSLR
ncbi:MAG: hypothetical protein HKN13_13530 [Rhodothermales bacterium]|nr:hypothetical protein [Rhodothermales bacterium]